MKQTVFYVIPLKDLKGPIVRVLKYVLQPQILVKTILLAVKNILNDVAKVLPNKVLYIKIQL